MVKNLWSKIELQCINHNPPIPLYVYEGSNTPFYACPKYMKKDEKHPDGYEENERACANRISFDDVRHLVEKFGDIIQNDEENGVFANYTGMKIKWKSIDATVLDYGEKKIILGIQNRKEIGTWHD